MGKFFEAAVSAYAATVAHEKAKEAAEAASLNLLDKVYHEQKPRFDEATRLIEGLVSELSTQAFIKYEPLHETPRVPLPPGTPLFNPQAAVRNRREDLARHWMLVGASKSDEDRIYDLRANAVISLMCATNEPSTAEDVPWGGSFSHSLSLTTYCFLVPSKEKTGYNFPLVATVDPLTADLSEIAEAMAAGAAMVNAFIRRFEWHLNTTTSVDSQTLFNMTATDDVTPLYLDFAAQDFRSFQVPHAQAGPTNQT